MKFGEKKSRSPRYVNEINGTDYLYLGGWSGGVNSKIRKMRYF